VTEDLPASDGVESRLVRAIDASLDGTPVAILHVGINGALIEHYGRVNGQPAVLRFSWEEERIEVRCSVGASELQDALSDREQRVIFHTELKFEEADPALARALASYEQRVREARQANLEGQPGASPEAIDDLGRPLRERRIGYISCTFRDGVWRRIETRSPEQPLHGFTVAAHESEEQLQLLRMAWEEADADGRRLLREFAAASLAGEPGNG
jgi:hypothetical protein